jgi:hypothetical protein
MDLFTCADGRGLTAVLPQGNYTCAFQLVDGTMSPIGNGASLPNQIIHSTNQVTDLGSVTIYVNGL